MKYIYLFLFLATFYLAISIYAVTKRVRHQLNWIFFLITFSFSFFALIVAGMLLVEDAHKAALLYRLTPLAWGVIYSYVLHFSLVITGYGKKMNQKLMLLAIYIPALVNIYLYVFNGYVAEELYLTELGWRFNPIDRSFFWNNYFYFYYIINVIIALIHVIFWYKTDSVKRHMYQGRAIVSMFIIAFVLGTTLEFILPAIGINIIYGITILTSLTAVAGIWYAMKQYGLMTFSPEDLAYEMLQTMHEGLIICDNEGGIETINEGTSILFKQHKLDLYNIHDLLDINLDLSKFNKSIECTIINSSDQLHVMASSTPLIDSMNECYGAIVILQNISKLKETENKLVNMNAHLEKLVKEKTVELSLSNDSLVQEMEEKRIANEKVTQMAYFDYLTNLPNMRYFKQQLERLLKTKDQLLAVLFIDLDSFKNINDVFGHSKGDELLIEVSKRFLEVKRSHDFIARIGGDEFILLIDGFNGLNHLEVIMKRFSDMFKEPFIIDGQDWYVTCSIGAAIAPVHSSDYDELMKFADIAMYAAKADGRNTVKLFNDQMHLAVFNELNLTHQLNEAIKKDEFELHYQPQIDSRTGTVTSLEALVRWNHPDNGLMYPASFIALAEKNGLINVIGLWVLEHALIKANELKTSGYNLRIAVNVSGKQLLSDGFLSHVKRLSKDYDITSVELEVTENVFLHQWKHAMNVLKALKKMDISIAIDDFGTEYSSLKYLKAMPVSKLKIDKIFVDGIYENEKDEAIIKTIITLAKNLDLDIVAEGVETKEQTEFLMLQECYNIQGYYYSKPLDEKTLEEFLKSRLVKDKYN